MKFYQLLILLIAVILLTPSCSRTNEQLLQAEQLIETAPDSAMAILNKYNYNKLSDKDKALYGLLYTRIQLSKKVILKSDSFINLSINYYTKNNETDRIASCYLYKGRLFKYAFQYEEAMECYLKALDKTSKDSDPALLGRLNFDIADIYNFQSDYSLARKKYLISYNYYMSAGLKKQAFYSLLNIGRTYNSSKNFDEAARFYRKISNHCNDSILKGDLFQEIGQNFYENNQLDSAFVYLIQAIQYPYIGGNKAIRLNFLAKVYFDSGKYDSSFYYANLTFRYNPDLKIQRESYRIMTNCEFVKGSTKNVTFYMNKYVALGDTIKRLELQTKGSYIETLHNTQKEVAKSHNWIWYLLLVIILIIWVSTLLFIRKHRKTERRIQLTEKKHYLQKAEIHKDIMTKKRTELLANIERIKSNQKLSEKGTAKLHERVKSMYNELLHIQDVPLFFCEMDGALNGIVAKLKANAPDINEKEIIWCCLQLLNVPTQDLLILLDYESVNSLKGMKRRLAQKLHLQNASLLNDLLLQLLSTD